MAARVGGREIVRDVAENGVYELLDRGVLFAAEPHEATTNIGLNADAAYSVMHAGSFGARTFTGRAPTVGLRLGKWR